MRPRRGDVVEVRLSAGRQGSELQGSRPGVIIQNNTGNQKSPVTILVLLTSFRESKKIYPVEVLLPRGEANLPRASVADCGQIVTVSWDQVGDTIGSLSPATLVALEAALRVSLAIPTKH